MKRLMIMVKENTKQSLQVINESMLLPIQIEQVIKSLLDRCPIKDVSTKFLNQTAEFMAGMILEIANIRKELGLKDGHTEILSESEIAKERKDKATQKLLRNFTFLTRSQIDNFIELVWLKYRKAQIQPGEAVGAVAA